MSPAAQMGCLRNRSGSLSRADQPSGGKGPDDPHYKPFFSTVRVPFVLLHGLHCTLCATFRTQLKCPISHNEKFSSRPPPPPPPRYRMCIPWQIPTWPSLLQEEQACSISSAAVCTFFHFARSPQPTCRDPAFGQVVHQLGTGHSTEPRSPRRAPFRPPPPPFSEAAYPDGTLRKQLLREIFPHDSSGGSLLVRRKPCANLVTGDWLSLGALRHSLGVQAMGRSGEGWWPAPCTTPFVHPKCGARGFWGRMGVFVRRTGGMGVNRNMGTDPESPLLWKGEEGWKRVIFAFPPPYLPPLRRLTLKVCISSPPTPLRQQFCSPAADQRRTAPFDASRAPPSRPVGTCTPSRRASSFCQSRRCTFGMKRSLKVELLQIPHGLRLLLGVTLSHCQVHVTRAMTPPPPKLQNCCL